MEFVKRVNKNIKCGAKSLIKRLSSPRGATGNDEHGEETEDWLEINQEYTITYCHSDYRSRAEFYDRYRIKELLGRGSQAQVRLAFDQQTQTMVAIKIFKKTSLSFR